MFLFETDACILYTGDYRIKKSDIRKFKSFYDSFNEVKSIDKIYLDTTFFLKSYLKFPSREDSLYELCKIIREWIEKGKNYLVKLNTSAKYGYEYVFNEIYQKIGMPVHVNAEVYDLYSKIPEMDNSVTLNGEITQIHSNCGFTYQSICSFRFNYEIRTIKISAFRWKQDDLEDGLSSFTGDTFYVCYSNHASYEEGIELIKFLKPKSIEACVTHNDPYINVEMARLIEDSLKEFDLKKIVCDKPKLFETNPTEKLPDSLESNCSSFKDEFGILNSPPRNRTRKEFQKGYTIEAETMEKVSHNLKNNQVISENEHSVLETREVKCSVKIEQKLGENENRKAMKNLSLSMDKLQAKSSSFSNDTGLPAAECENVSNEPISASSRNLNSLEKADDKEEKQNESCIYKDIFWFFESPPQESRETEESMDSLENLGKTKVGESMVSNTKDVTDNLEDEQNLPAMFWFLDSLEDKVKKEKGSLNESTAPIEKLKEFDVREGIRKKPKLYETKTNIIGNTSKNLENELSMLDDIQWILDSPQESSQGTKENLRDFEKRGSTPDKGKLYESEKGILEKESPDSFTDIFLNLDSPSSKHVKEASTTEKEQIAEESEDVILDIINFPSS